MLKSIAFITYLKPVKAGCPALLTSDSGFEIKIWLNEQSYVKSNWKAPSKTPDFKARINKFKLYNNIRQDESFANQIDGTLVGYTPQFAGEGQGKFRINTAVDYTFSSDSPDDGVNLYIDNTKLFEGEKNGLGEFNSSRSPIYLTVGLHDLNSLFYKFTGLQRW